MSLFKPQTLTVKRYGAGARNATTGVWEPGATSDITIKASVQPARGNELLSLPEGRREAETYRIYTKTKLQTLDEDGQKNPDRIKLFPNKNFEIMIVEVWQNKLIPHYKVLASLIDG